MKARVRDAASPRALLELAGLTGLAIAQPVLDVMGRAPDFFLFRGAEQLDIVLFALALVVLPPLVLWGVEIVVGTVAGRRARQAVHLVAVAGLGGVIGAQIAKQVVGGNTAAMVVAGVLAAAAVVALVQHPSFRLWFRYLAAAPIVFAVLFLAVSPVSDLVLTSGTATAAGASAGARIPVVVMMFDEFPLTALLDAEGRVDARLYPNFARLAGASTLYRNATTPSAQTPVAIPSALASKLPREKLAPTAAQYPHNLFSLLGRSHEMKVLELVTAVCPSNLCSDEDSPRPQVSPAGLLDDAWSVWRDVLSPGTSRGQDVADTLVEQTTDDDGGSGPRPDSSADVGFLMHSPKKTARFQNFLDGFVEGEPPSVHFLHTLLPHQPWRFLPTGQQYDATDHRKAKANTLDDVWAWMQPQQRLLLQTVYVDGLVGQVIDRMQETGLWEDALVVITADHGIGFVPGQRARAHSKEAGGHSLWVPLFIKAPGLEQGAVDDRNAMTVDIVPTIADLLDVDHGWDLDGVSLAGPDERPGDEKLYFFRPGREETLDAGTWFPELLRGMTAGFARPERGVDGLYAVGPHGDLVGSTVAEHPVLGSAGARAVFENPGQFADVSPTGNTLPVHVRGRLESAGDGGDAEWGVVAVNGRIAGVTGFFAGEERQFASMVTPTALQQGANEVELFLVRGEPGAARLEPVAAAP